MASVEEVKDAQIKKLLAEAAKAEAEARGATATAERAAIELERERRKREEELAANKYHHVYSFSADVSSGSVANCIEQLTTWHRLDLKCKIEIVFQSPGGQVIPGMALFDYIQVLRTAGHHITTTAMGYAASMAGILLQAGDHRAIGRESYVLIHEISDAIFGKIGEIEDEVKFIKKIQKRVINIFLSRCEGKISRRAFETNWRRKDWWLSSDECLKFGFVDEVR